MGSPVIRSNEMHSKVDRHHVCVSPASPMAAGYRRNMHDTQTNAPMMPIGTAATAPVTMSE